MAFLTKLFIQAGNPAADHRLPLPPRRPAPREPPGPSGGLPGGRHSGRGSLHHPGWPQPTHPLPGARPSSLGSDRRLPRTWAHRSGWPGAGGGLMREGDTTQRRAAWAQSSGGREEQSDTFLNQCAQEEEAGTSVSIRGTWSQLLEPRAPLPRAQHRRAGSALLRAAEPGCRHPCALRPHNLAVTERSHS